MQINTMTRNAVTLKVLTFILILVAVSCREENVIFVPEVEKVSQSEQISIKGFYLLNEGNMGSNKSTLDYYDYESGVYTRNIYGEANPSVPKEMGDVGNDIKIYGNRLYAVINCSNKVEVMDAQTAVRIGQIDIPNCRYIQFYGQYAYVTSYAGPVQIKPSYEQIGYVAKIDTSTLEIVDTCLVGFQPDGLEIANKRIYVANSGGYMVPNYENTVSVIDLEAFTKVKDIEVAVNLHRICADSCNQLWVSSRGDYYGASSKLYCIDLQTEKLIDSLDIAVSDFCLDGDSLYICSNEWSYVSMSDETGYGIVNVKDHTILTRNFITDGTDNGIKIPYGIMVNPVNKDILVTDAKDYVSPGTLYCFGQDGVLKWNVRTGDMPAHFAFLTGIKEIK